MVFTHNIFFRLKHFAIVFVCFFIVSTKAQNVRKLTIEDGLPSNTIRCMYTAKNGLLWIATDAGICSYNGRSIKVYNEKDGLAGNSVWSIAENEMGHLWISCYNAGLSYFDGVNFTNYNIKDGLPSNQIRKLYYKDGLVFLATEDNFTIFDGKSFYQKKGKMQVMGMVELEDAKYVISRRKGIYLLNYNPDSLANFTLDSCSSHGMLFGALAYHERLLLYKNRSLKMYLKDSLNNCVSGSEMIESPSVSWDAIVANDSSVYIAQWGVTLNNGGLYRLKNGSTKNVNQKYNISSKQILSLNYDSTNNILWVGSLEDGIYMLFLDPFVTYPYSIQNNNFLGSASIKAIEQDSSGSVWCLKEDGLFKYVSGGMIEVYSDQSFINIVKKHSKWKEIMLRSKQKVELAERNLHNLEFYRMQIEGNAIWISSDHGLFCYNISSGIFQHHYINGSEFLVDKQEVIFYHPYSVVAKYTDIFNSPVQTRYENNSLAVPQDVVVIKKYNNAIWYATQSRGLIKGQDSSFTSFKINKQLEESNISKMEIWNDSILVVSTQSGNVYGLHEKKDSIHVLFKLEIEKEIVGNFIYFLESTADKLLIGTNKGLTIYKDSQTYFMDKEEGYFISDIKCSSLIDDYILLGSEKGLVRINPSGHLLTNKNKISLNTLFTVDSTYIVSSVDSSSFIFPYNKNYLAISYDLVNLINAKKEHFKIDFQILGHDRWIPNNNAYKDPDKLLVRCLNLAPGDYRMRIIASNDHNNQLFISDFFHFKITPPFWRTTSFFIAFFLLISLAALLYSQNRIKKYKEKVQINARIAEIKLEALKSQMNPHFTFNVMNSIQNFVLDNNVDKALYHISSFSKLIRSTLDYSTKKSITLSEEIRFLQNYVEIQNMRYGNEVEFNIRYPEDIADRVLVPPMIIQPLIENVFAHAFNGKFLDQKLELFITLDDKLLTSTYLNVVVKDNGIGRQLGKETAHVSKGISITEERLQLLNKTNNKSIQLIYKDLANDNNNSSGTEVCLKIPLLLTFAK